MDSLKDLNYPLHASAAYVDGVQSPCHPGNEQLLQELRANRASSDGSMAGVRCSVLLDHHSVRPRADV